MQKFCSSVTAELQNFCVSVENVEMCGRFVCIKMILLCSRYGFMSRHFVVL